MPKLVIHQEKVEDPQVLVDICPFGAMEEKDGKVMISAACKMCRLCVRKGPKGAVEYVEDAVKPSVDKSCMEGHCRLRRSRGWKGASGYIGASWKSERTFQGNGTSGLRPVYGKWNRCGCTRTASL